ncbi:hypothetical protein B7P43_G02273 [Cryptotermes secundus]|uniref:Pentraxin (PTX) domain-containing protein n=1 Tax=Cryptotermes secundus TaxID=105785 RepID=A0A2J7QG83_9NEOP|nr:hypothetical protein B7P43_G02273 [Cryptotermes secundus]
MLQYIQYKTSLPDMKEFTVCMWHKFYNHTNDHPLFSYAVPNQPRAIYLWVSNSLRSSYFSLSVESHTFFRLNYPLRLNRWYHSCTSWNGRTGEWQIWVNAERVGRGFHNRLVGHVIPGGGIAITGQEQRQYGGGFLEGEGSPKGSGGFLGEVTQLYLYKAALAAGKAHRDHKHHHGNHASSTTPQPPPVSTGPPLPPHPLLISGQLIPRLNINAQLGGRLRPQNPPPPTPGNLLLSSPLLQHSGGSTSSITLPVQDPTSTRTKRKDDYPREPAEGEVKQVMNVCSGCAPEPFKKAELISWRSTPKKLYSGALYTLANAECRRF